MLTGVELTILILLGLDAVLSTAVLVFDVKDSIYRKRLEEKERNERK